MPYDHPNRKPYNWLAYDIVGEHLKRYAPLIKGRVFDLGAGSSPYKQYFLSHASEYIAVDWADSYHQTSADVIANLNEKLAIQTETADVVISLSVLEHLYSPHTMLEEACRILKPEGAIILQVPWQWWVHESPFDFFRYTPFGLQHLLEKAGFQDIQIEAQAGFFTTIILKVNYFSLRLIKGPRACKWLLRRIFGIFWYLGQKAAPWLDKFDNNWALETTGYFVTARKP